MDTRETSAPQASSFPNLRTEEQYEEFETWRARLVENGLEIYAERGRDAVLWEHFAANRRAGKNAADIGPPTFNDHMMGAAACNTSIANSEIGTQSEERTDRSVDGASAPPLLREMTVPAEAGSVATVFQGNLEDSETSDPESFIWPQGWSTLDGLLGRPQRPER